MLREALALWRGEPLADFRYEAFAAQRDRPAGRAAPDRARAAPGGGSRDGPARRGGAGAGGARARVPAARGAARAADAGAVPVGPAGGRARGRCRTPARRCATSSASTRARRCSSSRRRSCCRTPRSTCRRPRRRRRRRRSRPPRAADWLVRRQPPTWRARAQRKVVTVLFADVADSTGSAESLDPEVAALAAREVLRADEGGGRAPRRRGREVHRRRGDGRVRRPGRARGRRAARAARGASRCATRSSSSGMEGRIGVESGEVVVGNAGAPRHRPRGHDRGAARAGGAAGRDPARRGHDGARARRGRGGAARAARAEGQAEAGAGLAAARGLGASRRHAASTRRSSVASASCDASAQAWERVRDERRCELVTVVGAAGVGKSRLVAELLLRVDATVAHGPLPLVRRRDHLLAGARGAHAARSRACDEPRRDDGEPARARCSPDTGTRLDGRARVGVPQVRRVGRRASGRSCSCSTTSTGPRRRCST